MSVRAQSGRWTVEFQSRGVRVHRRCPRGTTKAEAQALEDKLRREIFATRDLGLEPTIDLAAAIAAWLTERVAGMKSEDETRRHAFALADVIEGRTLRGIVDVADEYRKTPSLAPATIDNRLNVLKAVAKFAWRKGWITENLSGRIPLIHPDNARHEYRTSAEVRRIIAKVPTPAGKAFIALAAYSGLRQSELMRLRRDDIRGSVVYVRTSKTAEPRAVPVAAPGRPYLKAIPFTRSKWSLEWEWRKARDAAGFEGMRYHDLRHTFASLLVNAGVDLHTIGELLGNKTIPQRYAHLRLTTLRKAVAKVR